MDRQSDVADENPHPPMKYVQRWYDVYKDPSVDSKFHLPPYYQHYARSIENLEVKNDDIWMLSYPRSGSTWTEEMIWCIANDVNVEKAKSIDLQQRFPFLERNTHEDPSNPWPLLRDESYHIKDTIKFLESASSPRYIKTHLLFENLPRQLRTGEKRPRMIYIVRNAKDVCISSYYFHLMLNVYEGNFEDFCHLFLRNELPSFPPYWKHVLGYWDRRDEYDILFLKYEDLKADLPAVIGKVASYLGKNLTDNEIKVLEDHLRLDNMKANRSVNHQNFVDMYKRNFGSNKHSDKTFIRKGVVDQWKDEMTSDMVDKFDDWISENIKNTTFVL